MRSVNLTVIILAFFLFGCSDNTDSKADADHVWKEQTDTIDKAKEVEAMMLKSAEDRAKSIEEQMQ